MSNMRMKHKLIMSMMAGMIIIPGSVVRTQAAETDDSEKSLVPVTGIENILEASYQTEIKNNINLYLVPTEEGEYLNIAFSNTGIIPILEAKQMKTVNGLENYILIQRQLCWNIWMDGQRSGREMQRGMFRRKHCSQEKKPVRGQMSIQMRMLQSQQIV